METNEYGSYGGMSIKDVVLAMRDLRDKHDGEKRTAAITWGEHEYLSKTLLPELMDTEGSTSIVLEGIGRLEIRNGLSVSIPAENRDQVYEWMRDNGYGDLIQGTVNSSTFKAQVTQWVKKGIDFPMDLIKYNAFDNAVLVRVK